MKYTALLAGIAALVVAMPASAQERGVNRRLFTFLDDHVTVEVSAEISGTLQVIRGEKGILEVSGRAPGGFTSFALGGTDENTLRLAAAGSDHVDFIVVIPEDAYLRVRLPDRKTGGLDARSRTGTFRWQATGTAANVSPNALPAPGTMAMAHAAPSAPRIVNVPNLNSARTITVRVESGSFAVGGTQWMSVQRGSSTNLEVRTGSGPEDLEITVPADTRDFTLRLGGKTALQIRGPEITAYCEPVTEQTFGGGARRFTFAPEMGRLTCR